MGHHDAKVLRKAAGQFEITRTMTENYDRTGLTLRRRNAQAELDAVRIDLARLKRQEAGLVQELQQIDQLLAEDPEMV